MSLPEAIDGVQTRLVKLERKAIPDAKNAVPYVIYAQNSFPYWTNRPGGWQKASGSGASALWLVTIYPRLILGHLTQGYQGTNQEQAPVLIAQAVEYFDTHQRLVDEDDADTADPVRWLAPEKLIVGVPRGLDIYEISPGTKQLAVEFSLTVTLAVSYQGV